MSEWSRAANEVTAVIQSRPEQYGAAVRESLDHLIAFLKRTNRPAPNICSGYWPTFLITWDVEEAENLQIEVFGDSYEVYRFFDGRTDIWEEPRTSEEAFSTRFVAELPNAYPQVSQSPQPTSD